MKESVADYDQEFEELVGNLSQSVQQMNDPVRFAEVDGAKQQGLGADAAIRHRESVPVRTSPAPPGGLPAGKPRARRAGDGTEGREAYPR